MRTLTRRGLGIGIGAGALGMPSILRAQTPGVTATEIKLGQTMPYSGPASAYGAVGRAELAYFAMVNDQGGVNGRKVNLISLDDGYAPAKTVEVTRRLVEEEQVLAIFAALGTAPNSATSKYLLQKRVPSLFVGSGAAKWSNYVELPLTMAGPPSYRIEASIYAKYILARKPDAKIAILWQNDDLGKDYVAGLKDVLGTARDKQLVASASYEVTDATVDSQAISLQASGADACISAATPKFAAQFIRKIFDLGWHPMHFLSNASMGVATVLKPAGLDKSLGLMSATYFKDPLDPAWKNDPGMNAFRTMMAKYLPGSDATDAAYLSGYGWAVMMHQTLKQCGNDLSRENLMRQASSLKDLEVGVWLPGIKVNTGPTQHSPLTQLQMERFNGTNLELFGPLINAI
jgi:branched-chain amino acid transport system substrate-binding protein